MNAGSRDPTLHRTVAPLLSPRPARSRPVLLGIPPGHSPAREGHQDGEADL